VSCSYEVPLEDGDSAEAFPADEVGLDPVCGPEDAFDTLIDPFVAESGAISLADAGLPAGGSGASFDALDDVVEAPPPPPPEPIDRELVFIFPNGAKIVFYPSGVYECNCCNVKYHGRCRKTKSNAPPKGENLFYRPGLGRPLGYLVAWAQLGCGLATRGLHKEFDPTWTERKESRAWFKQCGNSVVNDFLRSERPKVDGEHSEPENM
jgi:hypothetical protein